MPETESTLEQAARAVAVAAGDGCFERIDQRDCGCDNDCSDHEDAAYYRSLARAALESARPMTAQHPAAPERKYPTGAIVPERQRCICDGVCLDHCRACNHSGRDLEEPCIADPDWEPDDDDLARREGLSAAPETETETDANGLRDLLRLATPAPWGVAGVYGQGFAVHRGEHETVALYCDRDNARLIAAAVNALPALLADLDAARERVRVVEGEREHWKRVAGSVREQAEGQQARAESAEAQLRAVEGERDAALAGQRGWRATAFDLEDRAESAEDDLVSAEAAHEAEKAAHEAERADHERLRAGVEHAAARLDASGGNQGPVAARVLRALLAGGGAR